MSDNNNGFRPEDQDSFKQTAEDMKQQAKDMRRDAKEAAREARYEYRAERRMERRGDGIGVGITFIFIGVIWMLAKLNYLNFSIIGAIVDLWPLVFVVIGVNIIFRRVAYISLLTWVGFLTAIVAYGMYFNPQDKIFSTDGFQNDFFNNNQTSESGQNVNQYKTTSGNVPLDGNEQIKEGNLSLNFGTGKVTMGVSHDSIVDYVIPEGIVNTNFDLKGDTANLDFSEKNNLHLSNLVRNKLAYDLYLNDNINWYMNINMGASDCNLNFSQVPVRELEINGGAGDFDLTLSDLTDKTDVSLNMAAGDARLVVPKSVGLKIEVSGVVSDNNFVKAGLEKVDGAYVTPGYDSASKTINIEINSAASDISLERR